MPGAYRQIEKPTDDELGAVRDKIRVLMRDEGDLYFLFEPDADFDAFRVQLKEDTKALMKALDRKLKASELPYRAVLRGEGKRSGTPIKLLISPVYLKSLDPKGEKHWSADCIDLVLHVDAHKKLRSVRLRESQENPELRKTEDFLARLFNLDQPFFHKHYGEWDLIAEKIVEMLALT